jgi:regulator of sigma E protease
LSVLREQQIVELLVTPTNRPTEDGFSRGFLGVAPKVENWPKGYVFDHQYGIFPALLKSLEHTWLMIKLSFQMVGKLITGSIGLENLSGPISIAEGAGVSAQSGLLSFLKFLALISVNLGVINLLPLPVLDGGHLMYFFIELIRGKPVSERVQDLGFRIGAFVLMMIMGIAIINDVGRL